MFFKEQSFKLQGGCETYNGITSKQKATKLEYSNKINIVNSQTVYRQLDDTNLIPDKSQLYHNYVKQFQKVVTPDPVSKRKIRSAIRIQEYWKRYRNLRKQCISAIITKSTDIRPYVQVTVFGRSYLSLLDSGATISCFGSSLANEIISENLPKLTKFYGSVKTADGQKQSVAGTIMLEVTYGEVTKMLKFLVVPGLKQNVICGIDFWKLFADCR